MKIAKVTRGSEVEVELKDKVWRGHVLESYDSEIILLKLDTGYNIGIRQNEIRDVRVLNEPVTEESQQQKDVVSIGSSELRNVAMVITGGTISSKLDPSSGGVKWTGVEEIFSMAPEMKGICNIVRIEQPFMKGSEDMGPSDWKEIAKCVHSLLVDTSIDGVIVTHGTDTLHYTAAALSFMLRDLNKPVALTYSQRSIDRASTDAHLNLICAAQYAVSEIAEVAVVGHGSSNDDFCYALPGTKCRKMHSSRRDAFKVVNDVPLAKITLEHVELLRDCRFRSNCIPKLDAVFLDKVTVIKFVPGMNVKVLDFYVKAGYKGIIIEGYGLGQIGGKDSASNWLPALQKAVSAGVVVCIATQTIFGSLQPNVYVTGRDLQKTGVVFLGDMLSETAFVKLGWLLGHRAFRYGTKDIGERMLVDVAGELNSRLVYDK